MICHKCHSQKMSNDLGYIPNINAEINVRVHHCWNCGNDLVIGE